MAGADSLDRWSAWLRVLAQTQVDPRLLPRLDVSGVIQQTLLEACQGPTADFSENSALEAAWLRRIFANNLADEIRKLKAEKRDIRREAPLAGALESSSARIEAWVAAEQTSPSEQAIRAESAQALAAALEGLPEAQRQALVLHHWHGWPLAEIAAHLGRSRPAVAGLLKRGLAQLRQTLAETDSGN
ncbi:MAG TPA: sigma-70 family RNA polymerase sigma factor [Planctomycetia bacterium]|nr:sigma-70 family RNA polymerase sigma factor [Planctomycetia bacterium]